MRKFLQRILSKPISAFADKYSSKPNKARVHKALSALYEKISTGNEKKGLLITFAPHDQQFIILSDQHKGAKNGSDNFALAEKNYLDALDYYNRNNYHFIQLGDAEELWSNSLAAVEKYNTASFEKEKLFLRRNAFTKVFGNHDLIWDNDPFATAELVNIYAQKVPVYEGVILRLLTADAALDIFLTHGHQGDELSDGNWFSKWFVAEIWAPLEAYLAINPNTPATQDHLKTAHNLFMYEWVSQQKNMALITGHTHQPVFQSLTHLERLYRELAMAKEANDAESVEQTEAEIHKLTLEGESLPDFTAYKPTYFNSGCCCFNDGDITGIEIANDKIRLIKWEYGSDKKQLPGRVVLNEATLESLITA